MHILKGPPEITLSLGVDINSNVAKVVSNFQRKIIVAFEDIANTSGLEQVIQGEFA